MTFRMKNLAGLALMLLSSACSLRSEDTVTVYLKVEGLNVGGENETAGFSDAIPSQTDFAYAVVDQLDFEAVGMQLTAADGSKSNASIKNGNFVFGAGATNTPLEAEVSLIPGDYEKLRMEFDNGMGLKAFAVPPQSLCTLQPWALRVRLARTTKPLA